MRQLTVLYILDPCTYGGATNAFLSTVKELQKKGVSPIVCTSKEDSLSESLGLMGIKSFAIGHVEMITKCIEGYSWIAVKRRIKRFVKYVHSDIRALWRIYRNVNLREIDIIHTNSTRSDVGFYLSLLTHKPHIVHIREYGDVEAKISPINPFYIWIYNRFSTSFLCVSQAVKEHWIEKGIKGEKMHVVYDGIDDSNILVSATEKKYETDLYLVMSGGVYPLKRPYLTIEALGLLPEQIKRHIFLDFIGWYDASYGEELLKMAHQAGVANRVRLMGAREDVLQLLKNYHIGLTCSRVEGFGLATAEFMFASLGVIVADAGASPELVEHSVSGQIFKNEDVQSLSNAILYYYNNRDILVQHSIAARQNAIRRFRVAVNADNVYKQYVEVS